MNARPSYQPSYQSIHQLIESHTGIRMTPERTERLDASLARLAAERGLADVETLAHHLETELSTELSPKLSPAPCIIDPLIRQLGINESHLCREPRHFDLIIDRILPELERDRSRKLKLVSAGCAGGEEPFSLAMLLAEAFGPARLAARCEILGVDIDGAALARAREGILSRHAMRGIAPALRDRYFAPLAGGGFRVAPLLRAQVEFHHMNLARHPYPEPLRESDIILYRNVAIYFTPCARQRIFDALAGTLAPGGYLLVSATETLAHTAGSLDLVDIDGLYVYRKPLQPELSMRFRAHPAPKPASASISLGESRIPERTAFAIPYGDQDGSVDILTGRRDDSPKRAIPGAVSFGAEAGSKEETDASRTLVERAIGLMREDAYDEALAMLDRAEEIGFDNERIRTLKAAIRLNQGDTGAARCICRAAIEAAPLRPGAYLLMGLIAQAEKDEIDAVACFKKALYLEPTNWLARFLLASRHQSDGRDREAYLGYRQLIRLEASGRLSDHGLPILPLSFSREQVMQICRAASEKLACAVA